MRVSLNEFMADFENQRGKHFGFYDWFCKETSLRKRAMAFPAETSVPAGYEDSER